MKKILIAIILGSSIVLNSCGTGTDRAPSGTTPDSSQIGNYLILAQGLRADSENYFTSADASTWYEQQLPTTFTLDSVVYGNNHYLAIAHNTTTNAIELHSSIDGVNWLTNSFNNPNVSSILGLFFLNNNFVIIGKYLGGVNFIADSANGTDWNYTTLPTLLGYTINNLNYLNGKYFLLASDSAHNSYIFTASNLSDTWVRVNDSTLNSYTEFQSIAYGNGKYVLVAASRSGGFALLNSADGMQWHPGDNSSTSIFGYVYKLTYANNKFVGVGAYNQPSSGPLIITSTNGTSWTKVTTNFNAHAIRLYDIIYARGKFVTVGDTEGTDQILRPLALVSKDGTRWDAKLNNYSGIGFREVSAKK